MDLDNMNWVSSWDPETQVAIYDPQLGNFPLWRSFTYYVDSLSESVTELGTYDHPYKELQSVFVELYNFHSHTERNITIKIHEETINYVIKNTHILNITHISIEPYSKTSSEPNNPKITGVESESMIVTPGVPSIFKILSKISRIIL